MSLDILFTRLEALEAERRFEGRAYPAGIEPFPRRLTGLGFFPGGDGLWRDDDPAALRKPSPYAFPINGIMFLGNDFGTISGFQKLKLYENPPTWRWLRQRVKQAAVAGHLGFYTNAYLGLRNDRSALADPGNDPKYISVCAEYLGLQIRIQMPRLIVVFGSRPTKLLSGLVGLPNLQVGQLERCRFEGRCIYIMPSSHPYSDLGKSPAQRVAEGILLGDAWAKASSDADPTK